MGAGAREPRTQHSGTPDAERLALLMDACHRFAEAGLEPLAVLEGLCELLLPRLGDACHVRLLSEDGVWLSSVVSAHADPKVRDLMQRLTSAPRRADEDPHARVLSTGRAVLLTPEELAQVWRRIPAEYQQHAPPSTSVQLLLLPLRARQRPLGILSLYRAPKSAPFDADEQLLLQALADRAGLALDMARAYEAERRARHAAEVTAERLARLQRVTEALSEAVSSSDVARVIIEEVIAAIGASRALVATPSPEDPEQLLVVGQRGVSLEVPGAPLPISVAWRTGEPVWLESPEAAVALPLRTHGRTLGALGFGFDTRRTFSRDERGLLLELARQSAQALERAWLYEAEQQARTRAERVAARTARLRTLNTALSQVHTAARVAEVVLDQAVAATGAQVGGFWLAEESGTHARLERSVGLPPELTGPLAALPLGRDMPLDDAIRRGQPVWLESTEELARHYPRTKQWVDTLLPSAPAFSLACLPLQVDGRGLGGLVLTFQGERRFDDDERVFLTLLAHHTAQALERARLFAQEASAREALRDAHHTLEAIFQSSPTAITLLELDGTVRLWNLAAERIFGWKAEEVLGRVTPIVPEEKQRELHDGLARISRGESILGLETRRQRRDGSALDVSIWSTAVRVANERRLCLSVLVDITERKRAEEALRFLAEASNVLASSLDHELTLERVAHLAVPTYAEGCYVYLLGDGGAVSCVATARAGAQPELPRELGPLAPGASAVSRVITSGQPELCADRSAFPPPAPHFPPLPCELTTRSYLCVPLLVRGQTLGALSFVSSQRSYDSRDLELAQELARRAALAIDNARLYREARDATRRREEFLSIASHELRTPLTSLQLQVQGLRATLDRELQGLSPERLRRGLEMMERQVKRQQHLIQDLLDESLLGAGRLGLRPEPLELAALVREVAERFEQELARTGTHLTLSAPAPVTGHWDRMRLEQVVTNLLSNAVKYGQGNPIALSVEEEGGQARLVVRDTGIGIAPENLGRLFRRFERAVSARNYGGFGLGLWISRQVIEAMGGRITVTSELGVGSTFIVELPRGAP